MRALVLVLLIALSGCAAWRGPGRSSEYDWTRVTTPHFVLYTDLDRKTAVEGALELERTRDALISAAWPSYEFPAMVRTRVFVLANGLDFERVFGKALQGLFAPGTRPAFYLYGPPSRWSTRWSLDLRLSSSVLRHEMAHQLASAVYTRTPRWFDEGLAQFLETIGVSEDGNSVIIGHPNMSALAKYQATHTVTLDQTIHWKEWIAEFSETERAALYGTSWLFFHWLYNNGGEPFAKYQIALKEGIDPASAWKKSFPELDPGSLDPVLYRYSGYMRSTVSTRPLHKSEPRVEVEAMTAADAHAARAQIAFAGAYGEDAAAVRAEARSEVAKALELDPTQVDALLLDDSTAPAERLKLVRRSAAAHANDGRILGLLGDLLVVPAEREDAYRRALLATPDDPALLDAFAWLLLNDSRASEALPFALRALKRAPYNASINDTYAEALLRMRSCPGALEYETRALDRARESGERMRVRFEQRLRKVRAACGEPDLVETASASPASDATVEGADAGAAPSTKKAAKHEGWYGSLTFALGYGTGNFAQLLPYAPVNAPFSGGSADIALATGWGIAHGVALAAEAGFVGLPDFGQQIELPEQRYVGGLTFPRTGLLLDLYPSPNFHVQTGLSYIWGTWNGSGFYLPETPDGYFTYLSLGLPSYRFGYDLVPSLRVHYATLKSEHSDGSLVGVSLCVGAVKF